MHTQTLLHLNIRLISANFDELESLVNLYPTDTRSRPIICLTETWTQSSDNVNVYTLDSYQKPCSICRTNKKGGGLMCLLPTNIPYEIYEIDTK